MAFWDKFSRCLKPRDRISGQLIDLSPPSVEGNVTYHDIDFVNCDFEMSDRWPQFLINCSFESCRFNLNKSLRKFITTNSQFRNCQFHFKRATNWRLNFGQVFEDCKFTGNFKSAIFGGQASKEHRKGYVRSCDFSELKLDEFSFREKDSLMDCKFPDWPIIGFRTHAGPMPAAIRDLPEAFHDKVCSSIASVSRTYFVDISQLNLDKATFIALSKSTNWIVLNP